MLYKTRISLDRHESNNASCLSSHHEQFYSPQSFSSFPCLFSLDCHHHIPCRRPPPCSLPISTPLATLLVLITVPAFPLAYISLQRPWTSADALRRLKRLVYVLKILGLCSPLVLWYVYRSCHSINLDVSKHFGQSKTGAFLPTPTCDPSSNYLREECMRLQHEKERLVAVINMLR